MPSLRRRSVLLGLPATLLSATLCPTRARSRMSAVTQIGWLRNGEFAPILIAQAKGFFDAEGIDHHLVDGSAGRNPIPIVAVGQAQFGISTSGLHLVSARAAQDPVDIVAIGTLFQDSPSAFIRLADPGTPEPTPKDLEGKSVGIQAGSEYFVAAMARRNGIDESKIRVVTVQATPEPLLIGRVDYFAGWVTNQTYQIEQEAKKPDAPPTIKGKIWQALRYGKWGLPAYADVIFTTPTVIRDQPELVTAYLRAIARGMQFILDHPDAAIDLVAATPGQVEPRDKLVWRWNVQTPLFTSDTTRRNGLLSMEPSEWERMTSFLKGVNEIPATIPVNSLMTARFFPGPVAG